MILREGVGPHRGHHQVVALAVAADEEALVHEVLDMLVDGGYRAGPHAFRDLGKGGTAALFLKEGADEVQHGLLAFGEVTGFHGIQVRVHPEDGQSLFFRFISDLRFPQLENPSIEPFHSLCHTGRRP